MDLIKGGSTSDTKDITGKHSRLTTPGFYGYFLGQGDSTSDTKEIIGKYSRLTTRCTPSSRVTVPLTPKEITGKHSRITTPGPGSSKPRLT